MISISQCHAFRRLKHKSGALSSTHTTLELWKHAGLSFHRPRGMTKHPLTADLKPGPLLSMNIGSSLRHLQKSIPNHWRQEPMTLPKPGIYYFPWEVSAGQVPDGGTLRTFGRMCLYNMTQSRVTLTAQHGSDQHQILVCTKLVEPFQAQVGSLYIVLGELEHQKDGDSVVKARVLTCVEGLNLPLLEQAIGEQRKYQRERGSTQ
uniref:CST complex subunit TEN1 n=2 Tax=Molossus molossus TaxID=27622 RepID=A0A7J8D3B7_MOLMO|nr:TEN1 subunit of CST complex [Molossus molossus]